MGDAKFNDNEINRLRSEILDFANSVKHGREHTEDEWKHVFRANGRYHGLLDELQQSNGFLDREVRFLDITYLKLCEEKAFMP